MVRFLPSGYLTRRGIPNGSFYRSFSCLKLRKSGIIFVYLFIVHSLFVKMVKFNASATVHATCSTATNKKYTSNQCVYRYMNYNVSSAKNVRLKYID